MEAAYFNNSGAVQGVVVLTQEVRVNFFERYLNGFEIYSKIQLIQAAAKGVTMKGSVRGLTPGKHGIRIHEFGDIRDHCRADRTGPHYNPYKVQYIFLKKADCV